MPYQSVSRKGMPSRAEASDIDAKIIIMLGRGIVTIQMRLLFTIGASQNLIVSTCICFRTSHTTYRLNGHGMVDYVNLPRCLGMAKPCKK